LSPPSNKLKYRRVLIKLSGEALLGDDAYGISPDVIRRIASEVNELTEFAAEMRQIDP